MGQGAAGKMAKVVAPFIGHRRERSGADGMEAVTGGECSFKPMVFEGETGEEEWMRRRVSAGKTEKVRWRID
jgi:hypothetical protein